LKLSYEVIYSSSFPVVYIWLVGLLHDLLFTQVSLISTHYAISFDSHYNENAHEYKYRVNSKKNSLINSGTLEKKLRTGMAQEVKIHYPCVWLTVFAGAYIAGYNELVFGCCQPGSTHARYVFGYLHADVEPGSHDT
jgi:hypothetical protein